MSKSIAVSAQRVSRERDPEVHAWAREHLREKFSDNRAAFAKQIGYSRSAFSKYLDATYANDTRIESALRQYRDRLQRLAGDGLFVNTRIALTVMEACTYALERRKLVCVVGRAGNGKSTAFQEFFRRAVSNGVDADKLVYVVARSVTSPATLMRRIAQELGVNPYGVVDTLTDRVIARLKRDPRLIVIEDAASLSIKALHLVRSLYDEAGCGVVLVGIRELMDRILVATGRLGEDLAQIRSRVGLIYQLPDALSKDEAAEIVRRRAPEFSPADIAAITAKPRCARAVVHLVERVQYLHTLNAKAAPAELVETAEGEILEVAV